METQRAAEAQSLLAEASSALNALKPQLEDAEKARAEAATRINELTGELELARSDLDAAKATIETMKKKAVSAKESENL